MKTWLLVLIALLTVTTIGSELTMVEQKLADADKLFSSRKYEEAEKAYQDVLQLAEQEKDISSQVEALSQIARCRLIVNQKDDAKSWLAKAEVIASPNQPLGWSRYIGVKGRIQWQDNDLENSARTFMEMFDYCNEHNLPARAIDAAHMIAIVGNQEQQIEWGQKGIKLAEQSEDVKIRSWLGPLWNNLAITYSNVPDYEKCVDAFKQAREYHWLYGGEINKLYADYHVGWALRMKSDHDEALKWLRPVLAWAERLENDDVIGQASQDIGEITIAKGDKGTGLDLLKRALACYEREGYPEFAKGIYEKLKARIAELPD